MNRRDSIALLTFGVAPVATKSEPAAKLARIGYLAGNLVTSPHLSNAFVQKLRELGYAEGRDLTIEYRDAQGEPGRYPALAAQLVALKVDVIVAASTPAARAAKEATRTIPIVFAGAADPIASGLVTSLSRPGGNVTGSSSVAPELVGKSIELLRKVVPGVGRIAVLWHPGVLGERTEKDIVKAAEDAARALGIVPRFAEARGPADFERAFSDMASAHVGGLVVLQSVTFTNERRRLVDMAARHRLPAVYREREFVDVGGLMSYGPNSIDPFRRAASYVDRILKGSAPADLPVEQPTRFELVVNLQTARALGIAIPASVLLGADSVVK